MFDGPSEVDYALGRLLDRTYLHASFRLTLGSSRDRGRWARYILRVFDEPPDWTERDDPSSDLEWTEEVMPATPGGRVQVKFQVARQAGEVRQIEIERVGTFGNQPRMGPVLKLNRDGARRFMTLMETVLHAPVEGQSTVRIDDDAMRAFLEDPGAVTQLYRRDRERFRELIRSDASAGDVVALAHRQTVVRRFRDLLTNPDAFEEARTASGGGAERVWQEFLEANPWILGVSLAGQLLTSWDPAKLERTVVGSDVTGPGKRIDALRFSRPLGTRGAERVWLFNDTVHDASRRSPERTRVHIFRSTDRGRKGHRTSPTRRSDRQRLGGTFLLERDLVANLAPSIRK